MANPLWKSILAYQHRADDGCDSAEPLPCAVADTLLIRLLRTEGQATVSGMVKKLMCSEDLRCYD